MPLSSILPDLHLHGAYGPIHRHTIMWHLGKWDAPFLAAMVAVGVPFMGWVSPGESREKLIALSVWLVLTTFYWWIELEEILAEVKINGLLDITERNHQKNTMQLLYWGAAIAVVVWAILWAKGGQGPSYGWIEWFVIVHALLLARLTISAIYPLIDNYLQATAGQKRTAQETELPPKQT